MRTSQHHKQQLTLSFASVDPSIFVNSNLHGEKKKIDRINNTEVAELLELEAKCVYM